MKRLQKILRQTCKACSVIAIFVLTPVAVANVAIETESESNNAKNLARMNYGSQIECTTPDGRVQEVATANEQNRSAAALIMDDDTLSCPLQEGQTTFVIKLPTTSQLDRFTFVNENAAAAGELKISVSNYQLPASSSKWVEVDGSISFARKRLFNLSMVGVEARYVRLSFNVQKAGRIASLGLYGEESLEHFAARRGQVTRASNSLGVGSGRLEDMLNFDFANVYAKAHVVYVSSGRAPSARRMIDEDTVTAFQFSESDPHPTTIVELAANERLHRVSALYKMESGRLDVYLLNELSDNPGDLRGAKPIASVTDQTGGGKAAVDFHPRGARYVALRWTPNQDSKKSFEVAEINAFGDVPLAFLMLSEAPGVYASNLTGTSFPGEGGPDISTTTLGTIAVPPTLGFISP